MKQALCYLSVAFLVTLRAYAVSIESGQTISGSIDNASELKTVTFDAQAGDYVVICGHETSGSLYIAYDLYSPLGEYVGGAYGGGNFGVTLTNNGTYSIVCRDKYNNDTGTYNLSMVKFGYPLSNIDPDIGPLAVGDVGKGTIVAADLDLATFSAQAGDHVVICGHQTSGSLRIGYDLYSPLGEYIGGSSEGGNFGVTLTNNGTYNIICQDYFWMHRHRTGTYDINVAIVSGPSMTNVPAEPTLVAASDGAYLDSVAVSWNPAARATGYDIWRSEGTQAAACIKTNHPDASYRDYLVATNVIYYYKIKSRNSYAVSDFSASDSGYVGLAQSVPNFPVSVSASDGTYTDKVAVVWTAVTNASGYTIWRNTADNSAAASQIGTAGSTTFNDTTTVANAIYYYWLKATNVAGVSGFSASDSGWRLGPPAIPSGISASDGTYSDKVRITWSTASGATGYRIFRYTSNDSASANQIGTATSAIYDDTGAVAGTTYYYWLKATNAAGASGFSTGDSGYRTVLPAGAVQFTAAAISVNENAESVALTVTRTGGSSGAASVNYATANGTASAGTDYTATSGTLNWADGNADNKTITVSIANRSGTQASRAFTVGLSGISGASLGSPSSIIVAINDVLTLPATPAGVSASDGTYSNKVHMSWSAVSDANSYEVFRNTVNNSEAAAKIIEVSANSCDDSSITPNLSYYYWVKAKNAAGTSGFSDPDSGYATDNPTPSGNSDLALSSLIFLPNRLNAGDHPGILSMVLVNNGPESLALLNTRIAIDVYLSRDTTLGNGDDLWLGDYQMDVNLSAGHRTTISASGANRDRLTIPSTATGRYYVFAKVRHAAPSTLGDPNSANNFVIRADAISVGSSGAVYHPINDYDGDGKSDLALYEPATGSWYVQGSTAGFAGAQFGDARFLPCPGDFDGDGKSDYLVYTALYGGYWMVYYSESQAIGAIQGGGLGYVPLRGDFDGDGKSDFGVYEEATGNWIMLLSKSGQVEVRFFGAVGYDHVSGDFDGDGKTDPALYHASDSYWFWLPAGAQVPDFQYAQLGWPGSTPIPSDYDGDGTTDLAVYHPSHGWAIRYSSGGYVELPVAISGIPVVGDYDGDGKVDIAIYLQSSGLWLIKLSTTDQVIQEQFGGPGQIPVQ